MVLERAKCFLSLKLTGTYPANTFIENIHNRYYLPSKYDKILLFPATSAHSQTQTSPSLLPVTTTKSSAFKLNLVANPPKRNTPKNDHQYENHSATSLTGSASSPVKGKINFSVSNTSQTLVNTNFGTGSGRVSRAFRMVYFGGRLSIANPT